jgi:hypothetical protein
MVVRGLPFTEMDPHAPALFTEVLRRGILRTSPVPHSRKFTYSAVWDVTSHVKAVQLAYLLLT